MCEVERCQILYPDEKSKETVFVDCVLGRDWDSFKSFGGVVWEMVRRLVGGLAELWGHDWRCMGPVWEGFSHCVRSYVDTLGNIVGYTTKMCQNTYQNAIHSTQNVKSSPLDL